MLIITLIWVFVLANAALTDVLMGYSGSEADIGTIRSDYDAALTINSVNANGVRFITACMQKLDGHNTAYTSTRGNIVGDLAQNSAHLWGQTSSLNRPGISRWPHTFARPVYDPLYTLIKIELVSFGWG